MNGSQGPHAGERARIGVIVPSSNRLVEAQFPYYAPFGVSFHVARVRMVGRYHAPPAELMARFVAAGELAADAGVHLLVFHSTANAMEGGPEADREIVRALEAATGVRATTAAQSVVAALAASAIRRLVLLSPYEPKLNADEAAYLGALGYHVVHDVALNLPHGGDAYPGVPPATWQQLTLEAQRTEADGYLLSCSNIRALEAVGPLEATLGQPVITSNQAVLWYACRLVGLDDPLPGLGRLGLIRELPALAASG